MEGNGQQWKGSQDHDGELEWKKRGEGEGSSKKWGEHYYLLHDGAEVSASGSRSGGPQFKSRPRLISQSSYQLNQLGSKAASDSTLKQLTLAGYQILVLYFTFTYFNHWSGSFNPLIINNINDNKSSIPVSIMEFLYGSVLGPLHYLHNYTKNHHLWSWDHEISSFHHIFCLSCMIHWFY